MEGFKERTVSRNTLVELMKWFTKVSDSGLRGESGGTDD